MVQWRPVPKHQVASSYIAGKGHNRKASVFTGHLSPGVADAKSAPEMSFENLLALGMGEVRLGTQSPPTFVIIFEVIMLTFCFNSLVIPLAAA